MTNSLLPSPCAKTFQTKILECTIHYYLNFLKRGRGGWSGRPMYVIEGVMTYSLCTASKIRSIYVHAETEIFGNLTFCPSEVVKNRE